MVCPSSSKAPAGGRAAEKSLAALCLDLKTKLSASNLNSAIRL